MVGLPFMIKFFVGAQNSQQVSGIRKSSFFEASMWLSMSAATTKPYPSPVGPALSGPNIAMPSRSAMRLESHIPKSKIASDAKNIFC